MAQELQILETFDFKAKGRWSAETNHLMIEAMRRGYAQRAQHLGDADFVKIPRERLASKEFARQQAKSIDVAKATPSDSLGPRITEAGESRETTHFSVIDKSGNGGVQHLHPRSRLRLRRRRAWGAGFLLNNEMGDFNPRPGVTNRNGTIGTAANVVAPGKRMLSSMTPTIVASQGKPYLVTGSPGGRTIINTVFCVLVNVLEFGMDLRAAIDAPRLDHEWFPERVRMVAAGEAKHAPMVKRLRAMGHDVRPSRYQGDANSILVVGGEFRGAADSRWGGATGVTPAVPSAAALDREFRQAQNDHNKAVRAASKAKDQAALRALRTKRTNSTFVPRFQDGAKAHAGTEAAVPYLVWLVSRGGADLAKASMQTLMTHHVRHPGIRLAVARIGGHRRKFGHETSRRWLDDVIAKNPNPAVKAQAHYTRAAAYVGTRAVERSEDLRQLAIRDLKYVLANDQQKSLHGLAERLLFEATTLEPGLEAPDISGEDLDGVPFKLSDYRGKVVLLDFWGDW